MKFTARDAQMIVEAHEIDMLLDDCYEVEMLQEHNPELLGAYERLAAMAEKA